MSVEEGKFLHNKEEQKEALEYPKTFGGLFMEIMVKEKAIREIQSQRNLSESKKTGIFSGIR